MFLPRSGFKIDLLISLNNVTLFAENGYRHVKRVRPEVEEVAMKIELITVSVESLSSKPLLKNITDMTSEHPTWNAIL